MILLTLRDLSHRAVRFVVVTLLGAVVFALLFVMTGLVEQFNREPYDAVAALGAETWVLAEGVSGPFTASSSLPTTAGDEIEADVVAPIVAARSSLVVDARSEEVVLIGMPYETMSAPTATAGRTPDSPGEAMVDDSLGIAVGTPVTVAGQPYTVVGLTTDTTILAGLPFVFVPTEDAQRLVFRSTDVVSGFLIAGEPGELPAGTVAISSDAAAEDTLGPLEGAISSIDLVRALLWIVAAIIVGSVVYLSALERQRDFAVLKAVGASNRSLLGSLALQAVLVAVAAVALAALFQLALAPVFPLKVRVPTRAFWQLPVFAILMALVAGIAGMRRVARADPAQAFAGAGG